MSNPIWQDSTTRSRGQENAPASAWTYENKVLRITVLNDHRHYPGEWVMHCFSLGIDTLRMKLKADASPEQAQETALLIIRNRLTFALNSLPE